MNAESQYGALAPATPPNTGHGLWQRRVEDRYAASAPAAQTAQTSISDADKYCWIRSNRGNFAIVDALNHSDRDADFDARLEAAMRMAAAGRHYHGPRNDSKR